MEIIMRSKYNQDSPIDLDRAASCQWALNALAAGTHTLKVYRGTETEGLALLRSKTEGQEEVIEEQRNQPLPCDKRVTRSNEFLVKSTALNKYSRPGF